MEALNLNNNPFGEVKVNYPKRVAMKAITFSRELRTEFSTEQDTKLTIIESLDLLNLKASDWKKKNSNAGKYVSYSFTVTILSADQLEKLYILLNGLDVVKMLL